MGTGIIAASHYPWCAKVAGTQATFRIMELEDREKVLQFVYSLPDQDLFCLVDDARDTSGMNHWTEGIRDNFVTTIVAENSDRIIGLGTLETGHVQWTRHLGELSVMVSPDLRGRGLGKLLAKAVFAVAQESELRRILVRVTSTQTTARRLFQHLGFRIEAILADCVIDNKGRTQDLLVMSYDVTGFHG
jgi:L-amino acid N-acyltransferase YncA